MEIALKSGEKVKGQLIHVYDHSIWWINPTSEKTYAVFDAAKFADSDDQSFRFLSSYDIVSTEDIVLPEGTVLYRDLLRQQGMVYSTFPADGPLYVAGGNRGPHSEENGNGDFAWDIVRAGAGGKSYTGSGNSNSDYLIWDAPLVLPIGGEVFQVIRNQPDNTPGQFGGPNAQQNMLGVHLKGQFYLFMLHMKKNSIPASVQVGMTLPAGTPVGNVGNSGASIEPHLHICFVWYDKETQTSWGVPSEWSGVWSSTGGPMGPSSKNDYLVPELGQWISGAMF